MILNLKFRNLTRISVFLDTTGSVHTRRTLLVRHEGRPNRLATFSSSDGVESMDHDVVDT